ncbi:MAG: hydantoinase/oxoprolinase family protein [Candidatus Eremiobacteraeota bacterium]|nr:hydantoinase/oxoprolinase family protein [Candidatus Eremiobacteraeota bacterium]
MSKIRVGIDVGGTFTHAVAIDNRGLDILGFAVTPTTHRAEEGVARGVITVFHDLLDRVKDKGVTGGDIVFVAHSTTQATNALLEGDVAPVGILAVGSGMEGMKAKMDANVPDIEVTSGKFIRTFFTYLDTAKGWDDGLAAPLGALKGAGAKSIVAAEPFSVDDPSRELAIKEAASRIGLPACGTHEMSGLYGLRVRTRTAVINASILPKMMETATLTGQSLSRSSVEAPLMIMRSDGGVMSLEEMKRRPLLTLLSGPAAGIAAALTYIRATDAIFLEAGGTSTDITVIRNGKAVIRSAQIGGHITYMKTLDSRTLGIAGGSMVQVKDGAIADVGPRSAHIAGLPYVSFTSVEDLPPPLAVSTVTPLADDPPYLVVTSGEGKSFAVTTTCAANYLGFIREGEYAFGNTRSLEGVFEALAGHFGKSPRAVAEEIMEKAAQKVIPTLETLVKEYDLREKAIRLIGGGGGSYSIVPYVAKKMNVDYEIARNAEVISAIGAALAMVRDTIERNIFNPKPEDIEAIRREAERSVITMGAAPDSVEVHMEVDGQKNIVRAIATGSIEFKSQDLMQADIGDEGRRKVIAETFATGTDMIALRGSTEYLSVYEVKKEEKRLFNLLRTVKTVMAVLDGKGTIRLQVPRGKFYSCEGAVAPEALRKVIEENREYGDAGSTPPAIFMLHGQRLLDLSSVVEEEQIMALARTELEKAGKAEKVLIIARAGS